MTSSAAGSSIEFRVLGPVSLTGPSGNELHSVLARPKLVALLTRLAAENPGAFVRRDTLIGLLWPALAQDRARSALRQSLYHLRRSLGNEVILARGDEEVAVDPDRIWSDVAALRSALGAGDTQNALQLYRGDLLEGFFLHGAPAFEEWVEDLRAALRTQTAEAAMTLAELESEAGRTGAAALARRSLDLAPLDEDHVRRAIRILLSADDRVGAVHVYETFAARISHQLGLKPGNETRSLIDGLRSDAPGATPDSPSAPPPDADPEAESEEGPGIGPTPKVRRAGAFRLGLLLGAIGVLVVLAVQAFWPGAPDPADRSRILVVGYGNATGDPGLDPAARMAADWVSRGLEETGLVDVLVLEGSEGTVDGPATEEEAVALARSAGAGVAVTGVLYAMGDSLQIETLVLEVAGPGHLASVEPVRALLSDPLPAIEETRQRVAGALAVTLDGRIASFADAERYPPRYDAYEVFVDAEAMYNRAFDRSATVTFADARRRFEDAYQLDTTFKASLLRAAWSAYSSRDGAAAESMAERVEPYRESLTPHARGRLDMLVAMLRGDRLAALRAARTLTSTPMDRALRALDANRPAEARDALLDASEYVRRLRSVGYYGIEVGYWQLLANAFHMLGDFDAELSAVREGRETYPSEVVLAAIELRALAALGRVQEMDQLIDAGKSLPRARSPWFGGGMWRAAGELRAHGHPEAARAVAETSIDWYLALDPDELERRGARNGLAQSFYVAERWAEADSLFEAMATERPEDYDALGSRAVLAARRGDRDAAERFLEGVVERADPYDRGRAAYWGACVAAQLGDREVAIERLSQSFRNGRAYNLLLHADMDLEPVRDDPRFVALLRPRE
jgi:DNA-binding SARP family transcriptional activator